MFIQQTAITQYITENNSPIAKTRYNQINQEFHLYFQNKETCQIEWLNK